MNIYKYIWIYIYIILLWGLQNNLEVVHDQFGDQMNQSNGEYHNPWTGNPVLNQAVVQGTTEPRLHQDETWRPGGVYVQILVSRLVVFSGQRPIKWLSSDMGDSLSRHCTLSV